MNCEMCGGTGFRIIELGGGISSAAPCECRKPKPKERVTLTREEAMVAAHMICDTMAFAPPKESHGRTVIADALISMCSTGAQALWVAKRVCAVYRKWDECGIPGLRIALCSKHDPRDGILLTADERFPEGFPQERTRIEGPERKALAAGDLPSADPAIHAAAEIAIKVQGMKDEAGLGGRATAEEIEAAPDWLLEIEGYGPKEQK